MTHGSGQQRTSEIIIKRNVEGGERERMLGIEDGGMVFVALTE